MDIPATSKVVDVEAVVQHARGHAELAHPRSEAVQIIGRYLKGQHPLMQELRERIARHVSGGRPVLITGETGTGKQLAARALHAAGPLRDRRIVIASAGSLPHSLAQSELFGHRRGAFTGADRDRKGLFLEARGSTLVLDDVPDYSPVLQAMLLNAVEYGLVRAIGCDSDEHSDARIVATTNRSLPEEVAAGTFRQDLFYRLSGCEIRIPPLREHLTDIAIYAPGFLDLLTREASCGPRDLSEDALATLQGYSWPGNIRELQNVVTRAFYSTDADVLGAGHILEALRRGEPVVDAPLSPVPHQGGGDEETRIRRALRESAGNVSRAARVLGIGRTWMYQLQRKYGIVRG